MVTVTRSHWPKTRLQPVMLLQRTNLMPGSSRWAPVAYKSSTIVATVNILRYNRIHWQQSGPDKEAARLRPVQAHARGHCRRPPAVPAPPQQADADGMPVPKARREARSSRQSPKAKTEEVEELEDRSQKFPQDLNGSSKCSSRTGANTEASSANRSAKCASKPEALRLARLIRNLGCRRFSRLEMSRP